MDKHTPGEWKLTGMEDDEPTFVYALNNKGTNRFYLNVSTGWMDDGKRTSGAELSANARLIAAAPDLLEALRDLMKDAFVLSADYLSVFDKWPDDREIQGLSKTRWIRALAAYEKSEAAIAKATGE